MHLVLLPPRMRIFHKCQKWPKITYTGFSLRFQRIRENFLRDSKFYWLYKLLNNASFFCSSGLVITELCIYGMMLLTWNIYSSYFTLHCMFRILCIATMTLNLSVIIAWLKIQVVSVLVFRGAFMFLKPSLSEVSIIYYLPFSKTVWITFTLIVVILTFGQELSNRLHRNVNKSESNEPTEWSEAILNSIGIVCEQGNVSGAK